MVSGPADSVLSGRRLGVYELRERIGAGGMGEVYRARDTKLGRDVAIKILPRTGWSPDNTVLYLLLDRDGFRCLYAVRIDPQSGRAQGDVFPVYHFHSARWRWGSTTRASAVVTGLFISGQRERSGNVWMTNLIR